MGNTDLLQFPKEGSKLRNPPSPKLVVSGSMSQTKNNTGSPKSPKMHDDGLKSDGASSPSKSVRSPSTTKSSPGKSLSLAERLSQSTRGKSNPALKSPVSKSPPINLTNAITTSKTDITKEFTDQCLKSVEIEQIISYDSPEDIKMENIQISNEKDSVNFENKNNVLNEDEQDICVEINEIKVKENENENEKFVLNEGVVIEDEDSNNLTKPLRIDDSIILELTSKKDVRQKVWEFLEDNSLVVFPKPCFNRIPNFKGCNTATQLLEKLVEFKKAKTIQVTPDKAQESARFITLNWGKRLLVPVLRLKEGLLQIVSLPFAEPSIKMLKSASTQKGLRKWGNKLITLDHNSEGHHIDMVILGSVAVDRKGHRIGIGNGFCDLEFVILSSMNMVTDKTVIVTIVHDAQVFNTLPSEMFMPYDVPVDIIITSTEIIRIEQRLERPKDVLWNYISKRRLLGMPPLQLLRTKQEKDNALDCTLKEVDSEPEEITPSPKTYKKIKGYRQRRSYSTRSETNDSVFKDISISNSRSTSKQPSRPVSKKFDKKAKPYKRAKSTSSQLNRNNSTSRPSTQQNDQKEHSSSKKPNKRRTKSESAKTVLSPVTDSKNSDDTQTDSPLLETPKNKRQSQLKQCQQPAIYSDDTNDKTIRPSNTKVNGYNYHKTRQSRSSSRTTRRDYIDHQELGREMSAGRKASREYIQSPKKYYSQHRYNNYFQDQPINANRSYSQVQRRDSSRSAPIQQSRYSDGPAPRQTRYFNAPTIRNNNFNSPTTSRHYNYNGSTLRHTGGNNQHNVIRHNSYSNDSVVSHQNGYYDEVNNRRNSFSVGSIRQEGYTNSRVFRPPRYANGITPKNVDGTAYVRESKPRFSNTRPGFFNSNEKPNYSRSFSGDEFVLKVGNIANNVRVRDLKAALMERGVKPLHITWRGPRGFAYLRYNNSNDVNKDNVMDSLHNVRIKPNGVETSQTQTLIVTECQLS